LEIKEMPLEEKYERLQDEMQLTWVTCYAFHKEHGTMDKWLDYYVKVQKNMLPFATGLGKAFFKFVKTLAPGRTFKRVVKQAVYNQQKWLPLSNIELSWVSDREAVIRMRNCPLIRRNEELAKKAGLDIDAKFVCENDTKVFPKVFKEFGIDLTHDVEENGCRITVKLK